MRPADPHIAPPPVGTLMAPPGAALAPSRSGMGAVDQALLDGMPWPAVLLDRDGRIDLANRAWWKRIAVGRGSVTSCGPGADYLAVCRAAAAELPEVGALGDAIAAILAGEREAYVFDYPVAVPDAECLWFSAHCTPVGNGPAGALVVHVDVTERVRALGALADQASHDELTGLANRAMFLSRLRQALEQGEPCAVLFLDLDDFKLINDTLGHGTGDVLLRGVADRLRAAARAGDVVARLGGDEFTVLCRGVGDEDAARRAAERVHDAFATPFALAGQQRWVRVSVGCRLAAPGGDAAETADTVLRDADVALYQAKGGGKHRVELFSERTRASLVRRLEIEQELRHAVDSGSLEVRFQPQVDLGSGRLVGFEALARWSHPGLGAVPAGEFVSVAEERGLIIALGGLVLDRVCTQLAEWRRTLPVPSLSATVNVSAHQLSDPGFEQRVLRAVEASGVDPTALCLEVTESALLGTGDEPIERLHALRAAGLYVAIDDFGTGWSSLAQLKRLPVDVLKIDRAFVDGLGTDAEDTAIVASILSLAGAMGLHVIAEGVETQLQAAELTALGCPVGQGFLFAPAVNPRQFAALVERGGRIRAADDRWEPLHRTDRAPGMLDAMLAAVGVQERA